MTETQRDRLVPGLLDRLTDNAPRQGAEARDSRVLSLSQLRASVLRDLAWLFNATHLHAVLDLENYPEVQHSVLNFGLPSLAGGSVSGINPRELERAIKQAILDFEPRLIPDSIHVKAQLDALEAAHHNMVSFSIQAQLWAQPAPVELLFQTDFDLESGQCRVAETGSGR